MALFIFNRPKLTQRVAEAIAAAHPRRLLVVADGPRADKEDDRRLCAEARSVIDRIDWPCEVQTNYSETNLGCLARVASGLDWVFSKEECAIILEDDCLPHPSFFRFCDELLSRYRDDPRIHMIRGWNPVSQRRDRPHSYRFSYLYNIWGWASWARAWQGHDQAMSRWPQFRDSDWLRGLLPDSRTAEWVRQVFDAHYDGRARQWDFPWVFHGWLRAAMAITPACNLVQNIGFGEDATHTRDSTSPVARVAASEMRFPLDHPHALVVDRSADALECSLTRPVQTDAWAVARRMLGRIWHAGVRRT